jgi:hypothetical protein
MRMALSMAKGSSLGRMAMSTKVILTITQSRVKGG